MERKRRKPHKRRFKLPFSAVLMYLLLIAMLLSGVTFSKYMTGTTVGDTARVAYMKDISISEDGNFTEPNEWIVLPGVDMEKKATVHFEGSEMACYVFLKIKTVGWTRKEDSASLNSYVCRLDDGTEALSWSVSSGWKFLSKDSTGDTESAVYYCIVRANTKLDAEVLGGGGIIKVSEELTRTQLENLRGKFSSGLSITLEAIAVQYYGFPEHPDYDEKQRAGAAWDLVKDK